MRLEVVRAAPSMLVQDLGRPGLAASGVGRSGAMDRSAAGRAQRLVGNPPGTAGLEIIGAARLRWDRPVWVAVTGAPGPLAAGGRPIADEKVQYVSDLDIGPATAGVRRYLAVRGGLEPPVVLGSRSWDSLAGLGPAPLRDGDTVPIGPEPSRPVLVHDLPFPMRPVAPLRVWLGPRDDWFDPAAIDLLLRNDWTVSPRSDRTGIRLEGPVLGRLVHRELPSEPMIPGCLQVSPDGAPTILAVDAPVTGGYPVIAVVDDADLDGLAQLRPGQRIGFTRVG